MTRLLERRAVEKAWGVDGLPDYLGMADDSRIGEIWFEPPAAFDRVLVKYLFTSEKLSIQCHPDDAQAKAKGLRSGKEECWLILEAGPNAQVGLGLVEELGPEELRSAALDGSIEDLLDWRAVQPGDFFRVPAGTIHAIGADVTLLEIQQNTDVTYRLYDYGRPRELHLEDGMAAALPCPYPADHARRSEAAGRQRLLDGPKLIVELVHSGDAAGRTALSGRGLAIPLEGTMSLESMDVSPGECALIDDLAQAQVTDGRCIFAQPA